MNYCNDFYNYSRFKTRIVTVGNVPLGGDYPIRIQSMTNTDTMNTQATVDQSIHLFNSGCEYVRITTPTMKEAKNLLKIKTELSNQGYNIPLIADVHFNPEVAEFLAHHIAKVRINPGNYADKKKFKKIEYADPAYNSEIERIQKRFSPLVRICKEYGTALRIGVNHGSLSDRIMSRYGDTPKGMVESAMEFIRICEDENFHNIVLSIKSSNPLVMVHTCRLLVTTMKENKMNYPLHLGVTESGTTDEGVVKSSLGIGTLLEDGIGDTIRFSLTDNPVQEIPFAKILANRYNEKSEKKSTTNNIFVDSLSFNRRKTNSIQNVGGTNVPVIIAESKTTFRELNPDYFSKNNVVLPTDKIQFIEAKTSNITTDFINQLKQNSSAVLILESDETQAVYGWRKAFCMLHETDCKTPVVLKRKYNQLTLDEFRINASVDFGALLTDGLCDGIMVDCNEHQDEIVNLSFTILQACRARISSTEYISCPTCGRTSYDLQKTIMEIKEKTNHLKGLKIAVMGCVVNGPGEMADADYGLVGNANGNINLYKKKELIQKNIKPEKASEALIKLIKENKDWSETKTLNNAH